MNIIEKHQIKAYHTGRLKKWGSNTSKIQGWTSKGAQQARFGVIVSAIDFNDVISVLDVGCGYGDFKAILESAHPNIDYIGIDQQQEFITHAKQRFSACHNTWFYHTDFTSCQLPKVTIVVANGVLSYRSQTQEYYADMIGKFYKSAEKAFVFNMLDDEYFESGPLIVAHNKNQVYEWCTAICSDVDLIHEKGHNYFTVIMKKGEHDR